MTPRPPTPDELASIPKADARRKDVLARPNAAELQAYSTLIATARVAAVERMANTLVAKEEAA